MKSFVFHFKTGLCWVLLLLPVSAAGAQPPHIIFIVADDLGWNDVSWHNPAIFTPNLDQLSRTGVILDQYYVLQVCTPSRSAFMTGIYPFKTGMQHGYINFLEPTGLPLRFTLLPEQLQKLGYSTHMIGKWHLGYCDWKYTPTFRGFDTFFGFYTGSEDYYTHAVKGGLDIRENTTVADGFNGTYSTEIFWRKATQVIESHDPDHPLFLYTAFQSVHAPIEAPEYYINMYDNIKNKTRRIFSGMVTALDDAVGNITAALIRKGIYNNAVIIFTSDNGGQVIAGGNNYPLRGNKNTLWEGGNRVPAFIHSPLLKKRGYTNNRLFHAVDWFATINALAGGLPQLEIDGVNQWKSVSMNSTTARKEFVYNIDNYKTTLNAAIRAGNYKLIVGDPGSPSDWIPPENASLTWTRKKEKKFLLFNLKVDPNERFDLSSKMPGLVQKLWSRLIQYIATAVPPFTSPDDPSGDPDNWGGIYTPGWCIAQ